MPRINVPDGDGTARERMWQLAPEMGAARRHLSEVVYNADLPPRLRELIRMEIAAVNACPT